jgi:hypothetical protein
VKSITPHIVLVFALAALDASAEDIFDSKQRATMPARTTFEDAAAFLAATKNGEVPEKLISGRDLSYAEAKHIGSSIKAVLIKDYGVQPDGMRQGTGAETHLAYALRYLTLYENTPENSAAEKERMKSQFQKQIDEMFGKEGDRYNPYHADSRAAFIKFAKDYTAALKEYRVAEDRSQQKQRLADAEQKRRENEEERKVQEQLRLEKESVDAKLASDAAAEEIRIGAENEALAKQAEEKRQKLEAVLDSKDYQLWKQTLRVSQALQMIEEGQKVIGYEGAVAAESTVSDVAALRQAGEKIVAGRELLRNAFAAYKELGGTAATPQEVEVGPDPAEPYR